MRVLVVSARFNPMLGGVETHARQVATRLAASHDVTVVTSSPGGALALHDECDGVPVRRVPTWPAGGDPFVPRGVASVIDELQPDAVLLSGYQSVISARVLMYCIKRKIPLVVVYHEGANKNPIRQRLYPLQRRALGRYFRRAQRTVATAPHEMTTYQRQLRLRPGSLAYIPNGADLPRPSHDVERDAFHLVSLGRLESTKRHELVIDALSELRQMGEPWHLTIIGQGPQHDELLARAKNLGLDDAISIQSFGATERRHMAATMLSASLVLAPSLYETHPMAVIEAAALGCHVLIPSEGSPGVIGLAEHDIAVAVPMSNADDVALAVRAQRGHPFVPNQSSLWTWDRTAAALRDLLEQAVTERGLS